MKNNYILFFFLFISALLNAQSIEPENHWWVPNGPVYRMVKQANTVYLGGNFSQVMPNTPYGISVSAATGQPDLNFARPNGQVYAAVPDGNGGWYIGGSFTTVNGQIRNRLAKINSDGTLNSWNPNADNIVRSIAISGSTVYAGGDFSIIGGQTRNRIAAIDTSTGSVTSWNPSINGSVYTIATNGTTIYVGGAFGMIGAQTRNRIAAIDASTGSATSWDPNANNSVRTIIVNGSSVYAGGDFTTIGGQTRNRIAAIDDTSGLATAWNPNSNNTVQTIVISGGTIYAGGSFTNIGGQVRNRIAAINATTGIAASWNPNSDNSVQTIAVSGATIYVGGNFTSIGGQTRNNIAAIDASTAVPTSWNPNANNAVQSIAVSGSTVYAGGVFEGIGGVARSNIVAIDVTTGMPTSWNPGVNATVSGLAVNGNTVYVAGLFSTAGGQARDKLAAIDATTGIPTAWNPGANGTSVGEFVFNGNLIYVSGGFSIIGGQPRNYMAAIDATTGIPTTWSINANEHINSFIINGNIMYLSGNFTSIGGQPRNHIAAIDITTGVPTSWNPNANNTVGRLVLNGNTIYAGGQFTTIGGQPRNYIAAIDATTGIATSWNPNANFVVGGITLSGSTVYITGYFATIGGQARSRIAAVDVITGIPTSWNPSMNDNTFTVIPDNGKIYVNGAFLAINGNPRRGFAVFQDSCTLTTTGTQTNVLCNDQATGSATVNATGGTGVYTYSWNTTPVQTGATATGLTAGTYTVTVTDANLCTATQIFTITEPSAPLVATAVSQTNVLCHGNATGIAIVNATGGTGAYTYSWNTTPVQTTAIATGLAAGTYTVTVTDANLCTATQTFTITEPLQPLVFTPNTTQTNVLCNGQATGTATVAVNGGTAPYTYLWSNGQTASAAAGLSAGTYTVDVTDANGCILSNSFIITEPSSPLVVTVGSQTDVLCHGYATGEATVNATGGTGPYSYSWNTTPVQTTATATSLKAGIYIVTVTDANLCAATQTFTVTEPLQPLSLTPNTTQTNVICSGQATGSATIAVNGGTAPYSYLWNNGQTTATATELAAGTYSVMITDVNGCQLNTSITIIEPSEPLFLSTSQVNVDCAADTDGSITINATGGEGPYTYIWTPAVSTTNFATNLGVGNYNVVVTDANGCSDIRYLTLIASNAVTGEFTVTDADCYTPGSSVVHASGGVPPYTYLWSNGNTTAELENVEPGTYTVVITGANGCSSTLSTTINGTNPIIITSQPQQVTINGGETAVFTVQAQNVTSYQWQVSTNGGVTFTNLNGGGSLPGYYGVATPTLTVANAYQFIDGYQYRVILMQQNGCYILSDAAVLTVNPVVAGTDDIKRVDMNIYPNPASIEVFVEIPDFTLHKNVTLTIHDLNGRLIKKENDIKSEKYRMDILGLESGIYIITITSDNARTDKKLIVNKRL